MDFPIIPMWCVDWHSSQREKTRF